MGCTLSTTSNPRAVMAVRNRCVLRIRRARRSSPRFTSSKAAIAADTIEGASEFENRYGRDRCRSISTISLRAVVKPPSAPPSALPSVDVMMSTSPRTPQCSTAPRPVAPRKPVACDSSTITIASYRFARSTISRSLATSPSIEKTPSVAIRMLRAGTGSWPSPV